MEQRVRDAFARLPVPEPRPGCEARVVARVRRPGGRRRALMGSYWLIATLLAAFTFPNATTLPGGALGAAAVSLAIVLGSGAWAAGGAREFARLLIHTVR